MNRYNYSPAGFALTKDAEGCKLVAYKDATGVWTIGYGHTGIDVHEGLVWTQAEADAALVKDVQSSVSSVQRLVLVSLNQNQFDALVDFTFNLGSSRLKNSTLLILVNKGDFQNAALEFEKWRLPLVNGKPLPGILKRREAEKALFISPAM